LSALESALARFYFLKHPDPRTQMAAKQLSMALLFKEMSLVFECRKSFAYMPQDTQCLIL